MDITYEENYFTDVGCPDGANIVCTGNDWDLESILNAGNQELEIVFHFNYQENGNSTAKMDVPAQGALGIPVNLKYLSTESVSLEVLALLMAYTGKLTDGTIKGTFNQFGRSFPLDLKPGEAAKPDRPQEPE